MENRAFKIAAIKMLIKKNYGLSTDLFDVDAYVDDSLSMAENWNNIKEEVITMCEKENKVLW